MLPLAIGVLILTLFVREIWMRVPVYVLAVCLIKYLEARMDTLIDCMKPLA